MSVSIANPVAPPAIIHERIVLEAKRLLAPTTLTSAETADQLRFQDPSYFGRLFRCNTGHSPPVSIATERRPL